ncbi:hypothetical protein F3168_06280 [Polymorphobacter fuscus]|uniref:Uncharacterized protein n=1 Tax=Sandarakinorhabdus fusca TaxID=1439888 RepID=A0A7C9KHY7_9SPHN|nr:hypothetical protein F9290_06280 [Polymorphobacter fuscus]MQT16861.1 hypothetical protein [Polymorphobacter fuscus]
MVHLLGLVLLVGSIGILDLRLLGAWPALPRDALQRALTPLGVAGLLLLAVSGSVLFAADAESVAGSTVFRWKLAVIGLALANAALFRRVGGRVLAAISLAAWLVAAGLGRMIAYS